MPKAKATSDITLIGQIQLISTGIEEASGMLADLIARSKTLDSLRQQVLDALSVRNAQVAEILGGASASKIQAQTLAKLRAVEKSSNAALLKLQSSQQRESQVISAISNILKAKHDTIKATIGNVV